MLVARAPGRGCPAARDAEVAQAQRGRLRGVEKHVVQLDVAERNRLRAAVRQRGDQLAEEVACGGLVHAVASAVGGQRAAGFVARHQHRMASREQQLVRPHHVHVRRAKKQAALHLARKRLRLCGQSAGSERACA